MPNMVFLAGMYGFFGVACGAFGAHALKQKLTERGTMESWRTACQYMQLHAALMLTVALINQKAENKHLARALKLWGVGVGMFSGSIFALSLGYKLNGILGPVTPIGGSIMMAGWISAAISAL